MNKIFWFPAAPIYATRLRRSVHRLPLDEAFLFLYKNKTPSHPTIFKQNATLFRPTKRIQNYVDYGTL